MSEEDKELLVTRIIINETKETDRKRKRYIRGFEREGREKKNRREKGTRMELFVYEEAKGRRGRKGAIERKNTPRMGARDVLSQESVRSVSTPGAVQWPCLGYKTHPRLSKELCPGKGVTSAAEIAPPHISERTRFERWWRKERRGAKDEQSLLFNRTCKYISLSFFFISNNS